MTRAAFHAVVETYTFYLMLEVEPELRITQPKNPPSLTPESSNVAVVENLIHHNPSHIVGCHTLLGLRTRGGNTGKGSVMAYVPSRNYKYNSPDDWKQNMDTDLTNPPSEFNMLIKSFPLNVVSPRNLPNQT